MMANMNKQTTLVSLANFVKALQFAANKHRGQRRKDLEASPYINHPIGLVHVLLLEAGVGDIDVLCAAILHDTVEDTTTTHEELVSEFGSKVASIVAEVTDDRSLSKEERKKMQIEHAPHLSREAKLVKLADKICNLRDILSSPPPWPLERKEKYFDWAMQVINGLRGNHPELEKIFDQVYLRKAELNSGQNQ